MKHEAVFSISDHHRGVNGGGGKPPPPPRKHCVQHAGYTRGGECMAGSEFSTELGLQLIYFLRHSTSTGSCRGLVFTSPRWPGYAGWSRRHSTRGDRFKNVTRGSECEPLNMLTADNFYMKYVWTIIGLDAPPIFVCKCNAVQMPPICTATAACVITVYLKRFPGQNEACHASFSQFST